MRYVLAALVAALTLGLASAPADAVTRRGTPDTPCVSHPPRFYC